MPTSETRVEENGNRRTLHHMQGGDVRLERNQARYQRTKLEKKGKATGLVSAVG